MPEYDVEKYPTPDIPDPKEKTNETESFKK